MKRKEVPVRGTLKNALSSLLLALCAGCTTTAHKEVAKDVTPPPVVTSGLAVKPIEIKVVVVTMFEIGADEGDTAGEFQLWKARKQLSEQLPFAHHHDLFLNREQ